MRSTSLRGYIGFDFGTSKFRFYKEGVLISEIPVEIIEDKNPMLTNRVIMKEGKIASFIDMEDIVRRELKKINPPVLGLFTKPIKCFVSVPSDMNKVAMRSFLDLMSFVGSRQTYLFVDSLIFAKGLGIDIPNSVFTIVDCGAGKTSITTMNKYEIVSNRITDYAGFKFDESIITYLRRQYNIDITQKQAEELKIKYADISRTSVDKTIQIRGKDRSSNQYKDTKIQSGELSEILIDDIEYIREMIKRHIGELDSSISSKIMHNGIYCVGNSFRLKGFIEYLAKDLPISTKSHTTANDYMKLGMESLFSDSIDDLAEYRVKTEYLRPDDI